MEREELIQLLDEIGVPVKEGIQYFDDNDTYPQLIFFDYRWDPITASGEIKKTLVSYQISFRALENRSYELINLKHKLAQKGIFPVFSIEYIADKREWHTYFSVEVLEDV